jgi:hypothetical protein
LQTDSFNVFHTSVFNFTSSYSSALWVLKHDMSSQTWFQVISTTWKIMDVIVPVALIAVLTAANYTLIHRKVYHEAL